MDAVVTELNEEAEEMEKVKKDKRKERKEGKQVSDQTDFRVYSTWLHSYSQKQGRSCQLPKTETWSSSRDHPLLLSLPPKL